MPCRIANRKRPPKPLINHRMVNASMTPLKRKPDYVKVSPTQTLREEWGDTENEDRECPNPALSSAVNAFQQRGVRKQSSEAAKHESIHTRMQHIIDALGQERMVRQVRQHPQHGRKYNKREGKAPQQFGDCFLQEG